MNKNRVEHGILERVPDDIREVLWKKIDRNELIALLMNQKISFHILMTAREATVIVLHNHPSTKTFSVNDLRYLFVYAKIKMLVVVSNQGTIHYIMKEKKYDREDALKLLKECAAENNKSNNAVTNAYKASVSFLSRCNEAGLFYR